MSSPNASQWPVDPRTGQPLPPRAQPGYYPGFSTLSQQSFWDAATRDTVLKRVNETPPIRFFTPEEARLLQAVCDRVMPQDDRDEAHRIPLVPGIDQRLFEGRGDGYRYESMPPDPEAYRLGLQGIQAIAQHLGNRPFEELEPLEKDRVLKTIHEGKPPAGEEFWGHMTVHRFWLMLVGDIVEQYYAHPWAWDEVGFGGPAYPRAYMRLENGQPEPWEVHEKRYEWEAPATSLSGALDEGADELHQSRDTPGQGGTH